MSDVFARLLLSIVFTAILVVTVIFALVVVAAAGPTKWNHLKELLQILLPIETTLLGSAVGYYFGTRAAERARNGDTSEGGG